MEKHRNSNIEFARLVLMFLIVMYHYSVHGGFGALSMPWGWNRFVLQAQWGNLAVVIFVLITGYFMCEQRVKWRAILKLEGQVWFYSVLISVVFFIASPSLFSWKELVKTLFPTLTFRYRFASMYMVLLFLSPILNLILHRLRRVYTIVGSVALLLLATVADLFGQHVIVNAFARICLFVGLYLVGACLRRGLRGVRGEKWTFSVIAVLSLGAMLAVLFLQEHLSSSLLTASFAFGRTSPLVYILGISIFACIAMAPPTDHPVVNAMASCCFGVYLFHDHPYVRKYLWGTLLHNATYAASAYLWLHMLLSAVIVFLIGLLLDYLRRRFVERPLFGALGKKQFLEASPMDLFRVHRAKAGQDIETEDHSHPQDNND